MSTLTWYVGLDADGTQIGDALWNGEELDEATRARVVGLYRLTFRDPSVVADKMRGRAGLSDPGDGAGQGAADEAAESR